MTYLTLYGRGSDARTLASRAVGKIAGVDFKFELLGKEVKKGTTWTGKLPILKIGEECVAFSGGAIAKLFAATGSSGGALLGSDAFSSAQVDQWVEYAHSIEKFSVVAVELDHATLKALPKSDPLAAEKIMTQACADLIKELGCLEKHLTTCTFLVGNRLTLADIAVCAVLVRPMGQVLDKKIRSKLVNVTRWFQTIFAQADIGNLLEDEFSLFEGKEAMAKAAAKKKAEAVSKAAANVVAAPQVSAGVGSSGGLKTDIPMLFRRGYMRVKDLLYTAKDGEEYVGKQVRVCGWAKTIREGAKGAIVFVELSDGSCQEQLQIVASQSETAGFDDLKAAGGTDSSHSIVGTVVASPAKGQKIEIRATAVEVLGTVDADQYPLKKTGKGSKGHSMEFMREQGHLRPRTRLIGAVARTRNACAQAVHQFFREREFLYVHTPLITGSDCEGAGEMFQVTTLVGQTDAKSGYMLPKVDKKVAADTASSAHPLKVGDVDYTKDFFGQPTYLTVSGQLNVEAYACALSDVYTFGPTFRAENSHTARHLAEFWMIEPEMCFATFKDNMDLAEDFLKYIAQYVLDHCSSDIDFFDERVENGLRDRLRNVIDNPFKRMTYTDAIDLLNQPEHLEAGQFEEKPSWGIDLGSEHERYLAETVFKKPVILTNYPADIKAFYMKQDPLDSKGHLTVQAMDILVPRIGEVIGGSAREEDLGKLEKRIRDIGLEPEDFKWYLDLRRYGTVPHCGFGMGFERLVMFVTGIANIRDVIPFPRWPNHCTF